MNHIFEAFQNGKIGSEELSGVLDVLPVALAWGTFPDGRIRFVNRAFTRLFGYPDGHFATVAEWLGHAYDKAQLKEINRVRDALLGDVRTGSVEIGPFECRALCADGSHRTVLNREIILWDIGIGITTFEDISERKDAELAMRRAMLEDPLTQLGNRRALDECWTAEMAARTSRPSMTAVLLVDLDGFKPINDRFGHAVGDEVLKMIAGRLKASIRARDFAARIGGDEFAVVLTRLRDIGQAERICDRIIDGLSRPYRLSAGTITLGASAGASRYPENGADLKNLLRAADVALYRRKGLRLGGWEWFQDASAAA